MNSSYSFDTYIHLVEFYYFYEYTDLADMCQVIDIYV